MYTRFQIEPSLLLVILRVLVKMQSGWAKALIPFLNYFAIVLTKDPKTNAISIVFWLKTVTICLPNNQNQNIWFFGHFFCFSSGLITCLGGHLRPFNWHFLSGFRRNSTTRPFYNFLDRYLDGYFNALTFYPAFGPVCKMKKS